MDKVEKFLLNIVDVAWNECTESSEVPSTDWAKRIIEKANVDNICLTTSLKIENIDEDEKICEWKRVDNGMFGFHDYEYKTTCGKNYDYEKTNKENYCPNCGGKLK